MNGLNENMQIRGVRGEQWAGQGKVLHFKEVLGPPDLAQRPPTGAAEEEEAGPARSGRSSRQC